MRASALKAVPDPRPEEPELVERARRGDHDAYAELVREHQAAAFRVAYVVVGSAADAEDVAQEAFVKAYRSLGRFRPARRSGRGSCASSGTRRGTTGALRVDGRSTRGGRPRSRR